MAWKIEFDRKALKELKKLNPHIQATLIGYLKDRVAALSNPRDLGKPLVNNLSGLWRYRVGDYRIVRKIEQQALTVMMIKISHRKNVYD